MRQALSKLGTGAPVKAGSARHATQQARPAAHRHRFRQDGEIPVVRLALPQAGRVRERQAAAPAVGPCERDARSDAAWNQNSAESARQVQELGEQLHRARTRLGHAELALEEAGRLARASQDEARMLRQALEDSRAALAQAHGSRPTSQATEPAVARRKVGRPPGSTSRTRSQDQAGEPTPVKWWDGD